MQRILVASASILFFSLPCFGQDIPDANPSAVKRVEHAPLPPDARSKSRIVLRGKSIEYTAIAGSLPALDESGVRRGDIAYVAYLAQASDPATRPITFAFNGGPSVSSASVHLAFGPKRLPPRGSSLPPASLIDNADSWLDFTDLVFIDPVGTGWSRALGSAAEGRKYFWGVQQDIDSLSRFVKAWIVQQRRWQSPKYLVGASYGGIRSARMAKQLGSLHVSIDGLVMLSPAIDFIGARGGQRPLAPAIELPTLTAAAIEKATGRDIDPAQLAEVERYALTDYATDLLRGVNDRDAVDRMSEKVAKFTGLDPALVRRMNGRIDGSTFRRELWRSEGRIGGTNDLMSNAYDTDPAGAPGAEVDAGAPGPSVVADYVANVLGWKVDAPYEWRLRGASWDWNSEDFLTPGLDGTPDLRDMLAANPDLRVLVAHGATDPNTVYMNSKLIIDQIPDFGGAQRLQLKLYPGGHGFYGSREASRRLLHDDVRAMYENQRK